MRNLESCRRHVERRLTPRRYRHSICVQRRAVELARLHGADWWRAGLAGLLHDVCHCDTPECQLAYLAEHGVALDEELTAHPPVWHAVTGSIYIREELGVTDPEVIRAVRYHTTGRAGMGLLEKVVYLADATSEDREYVGVEDIRRIADENPDRAMGEMLAFTLKELALSKKTIVKDAWEGYNDYIAFTEQEEL